jgi:glutaryl-CoA dehydrogenase (non-decarboxylating)
MIDLELTEEQRLLEQTVREWAGREVAPRIKELDRAHSFDPKILPQMASLGLLGISVPVEYGGAGMDYICLGLASEELEYVDTSLRVILSVHAGLNCLSLLTWGERGSEAAIPCAPGAGDEDRDLRVDRAGRRQRRSRHSDCGREERRSLGTLGEKMWISLADVADNFLVFAWSDARKKKQRDPSGISAFIVERGFKGFSSGTLKEKWGILAGNTGHFKMDEVEVPEENVLGRVGEGFKVAMFALDQGRYTVAAGATGLIRACRDAVGEVRAAAPDVRAGDRRAPAREADDRAHGVRLPGVAPAVAACRVSSRTTACATRARPGLAKWYSTVASERAAGDAGAGAWRQRVLGRVSGRDGSIATARAPVIYEGTREVHTLMQADYVLGYRQDKPTRCELPAWRGSE